MKLLYALLLGLTPLASIAQLTVNNGFTAQQLGNNLAGANVTVTNATITGDPDQYGTFTYAGTGLGVNSGVILSTGDIFDAQSTNTAGNSSTGYGNPGDPDLTSLAGFPTNDAVVFEFDFEVQGSDIAFNFIFLSEEYNEYVNTGFNDVFAFYISGPGIVGQQNLAVVPGTTTPVSINTINNGSFWQFYNDNTNGAVPIEFDGFTTLMTASMDSLIQCGVYTLSLRIADGSDFILDSGVLLQENSLVQSNVSAQTNTVNANGIALEGCIQASFTFNLDSVYGYDISIPYGIGGSATNGVDYATLDTVLTIPAGQSSATIIIDAFADGINEGQESIELYFTPYPCAPVDTVVLLIDDNDPIEFSLAGTDLICANDGSGVIDMTITGGFPPYTITITDTATGVSSTYDETQLPISGWDSGTYLIEIEDTYGCTAEAVVIGGDFDAGTTFLPDGTGVSYTSDITIAGFNAGQLITSASQINSICATMEHSYANDLTIVLQAPDGTQVQLKNVGPTGGAINACNLGEPVASGPVDNWNSTNTTPGVGYQYCWNNTPTYAEMGQVISPNFPGPPPFYTYTSTFGNVLSDYYLPPGSYTPTQNLSGFVGAPLNGTWTLIVTDNYGLDNGYIFDWEISLTSDLPDSTITLNEPADITITGGVTNAACGANDGAIDITPAGAFPPFTYSWLPGGQTTQDISGIGAGTYTVTVTDANGCTNDTTYNVPNAGAVTVGSVVSDASCAGASDGGIDITITSGTSPYTYVWDHGPTTEDVTGLTAGVYTVTITDGNGCIGIETYTVGEAIQLNSTALITNENCGDQEGEIDLNVTGGTAPFTYVWSNGETTADITDLQQGQYYVDITDANGCTISDTFNVINLVGNCTPNCDLIISNNVVTDESCGDGAGAIDITIFTSNSPYSVSWDNGANTEDLSGLSAGTYTVTIDDAEGCQVIQTFTITNQTGGLALSNPITTNDICGAGVGGVDITVTGGAMPYTYAWDNGATTEDLTNVFGGTYSVTITDANGCMVNGTYTIINDAGNLALTYGNATDEVCGQANGSIDIIVGGGNFPYSYLWSNGETTEDLVNLSAGTYTCTITDDNGCVIFTPTYTVSNDPGTLAIDYIDVDDEACSNAAGEITLTISGGATPYTFLWSNGATTQNLSNLSAGTFDCTITDANGCALNTGNLNVINLPGTLSLDGLTVLDEVCGNGLGAINLSVSGGTAPLTYSWSNGSNSEDLSNLSAGNYSVTVTDANGCSIVANATVVDDPGTLAIDNFIITNENCGNADGALDLIISGQTNPVSYLWSNGATSQDLSNIPGGNYTVDVTDANGCTVSGSVTVVNDAGTLSLDNSSVTNEVCGNGQGAIDITVSGGNLPLSYSWDNGTTTEDLTGLSVGTYTCTITDATNCSITAGPYTIGNGSGTLAVSNVAVTDETCGNSAGAIDITISGGTAPFAYSWSNGPTTEDITGLSAGTFSVTVTDANGCTATANGTVNDLPGTLSLDGFNVTDEICANNQGGIDITISGGTAPYSYNWSNGPTSEDISNLSTGSYDVTITDANGCSVNSGPIAVNNTSGNFLLDNINVTNEICGDGSGDINITVLGGQVPISYSWSNGATTEDISGLSAGVYTATITDGNGCVLNFSAVVGNDAGSLQIDNALVADANCGNNDGGIDLTITGGTAPLTFVWSNGATTEDLTNVPGGSYTCNITDANGCTLNYTGTVNDNGANISLTNIQVTDEVCGGLDGSITVSTTGGTGPYTYSWTGPITNCCTYTLDMQDQGNSWNGGSIDVFLDGNFEGQYTVPGGGANVETFSVCAGQTIQLFWNSGQFDNEVSFDLLDGQGAIVFSQGGNPPVGLVYAGTANCVAGPNNTNTLSNLGAGTYTVTVTDANGCSTSQTITVNNSTGQLQISNPIITDEWCGLQGGAIDVTIGGNNPVILWSNGETTEDLTNISAGTYWVDVTDNSGCSISDTFTVVNNTTGIMIGSVVVTDETCSDGQGGIDITMTGGNLPYTFAWSNGATTEDLAFISAGTYDLTVTDATGCPVTAPYTVVNNANGITASATTTDDFCSQGLGGIDLTATGNNPPLTYLWSNGATTEDLTNVVGGIYSVTITDATGCAFVYTDTIADQLNTIAIFNVNENDEDCGTQNGDLFMSVAGNGPFTYLWSNGNTNQDLTNVGAGTYTVLITDANGCTLSDTFTVTSDAPWDVDNSIVTDENCSDGAGSIALSFSTVPGGPISYTWSNGATTQGITGLSQGWYSVTITAGNGCSLLDSFFVDNSNAFTIDQLAVTDATCNQANGAIDMTITGGTAPFTYSWSNTATTEDLTGVVPGTYVITVTDASGCTVIDSATIGNNNFGFGIAGSIIVDELCGDGTGSIDISVAGGTGPYTFAWSNSATTEDITGLNAGSYTVDITDNTGCLYTETFVVGSQLAPLGLSAVVTDETCTNAAGAIDLTVAASFGPYTYDWQPGGATTEDVTGLSAGNYTVVVTGAGGCSDSATYAVSSTPGTIAITSTVTDELCGDGTGAIDITVAGGTAPYTYSWAPNGETTEDLSGLSAGTYDVTATDANGCTETASITVNNTPSSIAVTSVVTDETCTNAQGAIDITATGGTAPYTYSWAPNGETTEDLSGLSAGTYDVTVTDANGCTEIASIVVNSAPGNIAVTSIVTNEICGNGQGGIDITVTGGTAPYSFDWGPGAASTEDISGFSNGSYDCYITDANGCTYVHTDSIGNDPGTLAVTTVMTEETCAESNGAIDLTTTGGTPPLTFSWSNGETTEDVSGLTAGPYSCTVTDANGCSFTTFDTIVDNTLPVIVTSSIVTDASDGSTPDGAIDISVDGSGNPHTFSWSNGETTEDISGLVTGWYTVTITNAFGCTLDTTFRVGDLVSLDENEGSAFDINVYPNPSNGVFNIEFDAALTGELEIMVFDNIGKLIHSSKGTASELNGNAIVDISTVESGNYFVRVKTVNGFTFHRITIMH